VLGLGASLRSQNLCLLIRLPHSYLFPPLLCPSAASYDFPVKPPYPSTDPRLRTSRDVSSSPGCSFRCFKRKRKDDHSQRKALGVHASLHKLLGTGKVWISTDESESTSHGGSPRSRDYQIAVARGPVKGTATARLLRQDFLLKKLRCI
jgi:hypothetical protein